MLAFLPPTTRAKLMYTKITLGNVNLQGDKEPCAKKGKLAIACMVTKLIAL